MVWSGEPTQSPSMRPRRLGRGNPPTLLLRTPPLLTFNEAAPVRARKCFQPAHLTLNPQSPSMRPRRLGRGNRGVAVWIAVDPAPSMRPRRLGRGNRCNRQCNTIYPLPFNEAAPVRARKYQWGQCRSRYLSPSMRPRRLGRGNLAVPVTSTGGLFLQ